ncbi:hypothetical protein TNCV_4400651 [Trichonephila clavipes]|nr:hypothetical protein TNCV_4400651 [Trichonephila clavipes]
MITLLVQWLLDTGSVADRKRSLSVRNENESGRCGEVLNVSGINFKILVSCSQLSTTEQKYPGETVPNASMITLLVQWLLDTGSVADRKRSG